MISHRLKPVAEQEAAKKVIKLSVAGDVMLGRLVDQVLPAHVPATDEERYYIKSLKSAIPRLKYADASYPFGNLLPIFQSDTDLSIINLETCITTSDSKWPKTFNYRMHPKNVQVLSEAKIDYCSLANNHVLDYGVQGLKDTMRSLSGAGISFAGKSYLEHS